MHITGCRIWIYNTVLAIVLLSGVLPVAGCGLKKDDCAAPDGSTITISPETSTWETSGNGFTQDVQNEWTVKVIYPDATPMPYACVRIWGSLAVPNGYGAYQFQYYSASTVPNTAVDSGFTIQTDEFGQYTFSTLIPAGTGPFFDTLYFQSGASTASAELRVN